MCYSRIGEGPKLGTIGLPLNSRECVIVDPATLEPVAPGLRAANGDIPVSAILRSSSLHDSQAAIPLSQMSRERVTNHYDLMAAAYDSPGIHAFSKSPGHRPIIDNNPRRKEKILMDPATKSRFAQRSSAERVNSYLKDHYGGRSIRVKGASKVMTHLMFGIVSITAMQLYRLLL